MTVATVAKQISEIVRWYVRNNRLPKQTAACKNERKLANWLRYMKQKAQAFLGRRRTPPRHDNSRALDEKSPSLMKDVLKKIVKCATGVA